MDDDVFLVGGILHLRAQKRPTAGLEPPGAYAFSAGLIQSKKLFLYGYIEIRAKFDLVGPGSWPAFWLVNPDQWPPEFDIAEFYGISNVMHHGLCHGTLKNVEWDSTGEKNEADGNWHTYALDWHPGVARWFFDGKIKKTIGEQYVPDIPMCIILSNGVSSHGAAGRVSEQTVFPNTFQVDYVRVYQ